MRLPIGVTEFNAFCVWIFRVYGIPDLPGYRQSVATMIMHLKPTVTRVAPSYFARSIRKAQANEIAYQTIREIQDQARKEKEAQVVAAEKPALEVVSSGTQT